ncbi:MAG TPA: aldehyde dehydrogenase family protein, partial [Halomonas sp.]|nr:aldehyde dehydrogenase family protein [Halomonas sp.]
MSTQPLSVEEVFAQARDGKLWAGHLIPGLTENRDDSFATLAPHDGSEIGRVAKGSSEVIDQAVKQAREGFNSGVWSKLAPAERKQAMQRWIALLEQH